MEKKLKIVIADESADLGQNCAKAFTAYGMNVILCEKDGRALLKKIKSEKPDIILSDVFMPNLDILGVVNSVSEMEFKEKPMVMAVSSFNNERLERELLNAGVDYYFLRPFDTNTMAERIIQLSGWKNEKTPLVVKNNVAINCPNYPNIIFNFLLYKNNLTFFNPNYPRLTVVVSFFNLAPINPLIPFFL